MKKIFLCSVLAAAAVSAGWPAAALAYNDYRYAPPAADAGQKAGATAYNDYRYTAPADDFSSKNVLAKRKI